MILVDTSVWIEVMRANDPLDLDAVADFNSVATCPPVVQEVLQGIREESAFRLARQAMLELPMIDAPMPIEVWIEGAQLYRVLRGQGVTVRSSVDCLIAACAIRHDLAITP
jgi:predicted nucleic acid-binding protein